MHEGHRARLRARYAKTGLDSFAPHEVLELLLTYAIPRRDVNPIAHELLSAFGSLAGVLEATSEQLATVPGVGEGAATLLSLIPAVMRAYERSALRGRVTIRNHADAAAYCLTLLRGRKNERLYCVALNARMEVVGHAQIGQGTSDEVAAYPRLAAEYALHMNAKAVLLAHNHPSGHAAPSMEDLEATGLMMRALRPLGITVCDHIIIGSEDCYSFRKGDLLDRLETLDGQAAADSGGSLLAHGADGGYIALRGLPRT